MKSKIRKFRTLKVLEFLDSPNVPADVFLYSPSSLVYPLDYPADKYIFLTASPDGDGFIFPFPIDSVPEFLQEVFQNADGIDMVMEESPTPTVPPPKKDSIADIAKSLFESLSDEEKDKYKEVFEKAIPAAAPPSKHMMDSVMDIANSIFKAAPLFMKTAATPKKKYPIIKIKKDIKAGDLGGIPFAMPAGTAIDINYVASIMPQAADIIVGYMKSAGSILDKDNDIVEVIWPEKKPVPPNLSDAIKQGSEDSEQLIGGFFEDTSIPPMPPGPPFSDEGAVGFFTPGGKVTKIEKKWTPSKLYSSFEVKGNSPPLSHKQHLFVNGLGQDGNYQAETNMYVGGLIPLSHKFRAMSLQVYTNLPPTTPSVLKFLSGAAITFKSASQEIILGTLAMFLERQSFEMTLESGMDFRFDVQWDASAQYDFHEEFKDPWWMQYVPADKKTPPRNMKVWVVMHGFKHSAVY